MSVARKLKNRHKFHTTQIKREPPVLIVRPQKPEVIHSCQPTDKFVTRAIVRGIAECQSLNTKAPELARNYCIADFLRNHPKKTHIFFLDDDSPPQDNFAIEKLLVKDKPVICAPTPIWRSEKDLKHFHLLWNTIVTAPGHTKDNQKLDNLGADELPKKLFKCWRVGGTGLLVRRDVLQKLKPPYQVTTYNESHTDVLTSEDIYFSDKIREAGYDIWADPETVCRHFHALDILDVFSVYLQARKE